MLLSFCNQSVVAESLDIVVVGTKSWCIAWPRPQPLYADCVRCKITVSKEGVNIDEFITAALGPARSSLMNKWHKALTTRLNSMHVNANSMTLATMLQALASEISLASLYRQVLWALVVRLQRSFSQHVKALTAISKKLLKSSNVVMSWASDDDMKKLDQTLCRYVRCSYALNHRSSQVGISTDKGMVHGLPLQATILSFANNKASFTCPVVSHLQEPSHPQVGLSLVVSSGTLVP